MHVSYLVTKIELTFAKSHGTKRDFGIWCGDFAADLPVFVWPSGDATTRLWETIRVEKLSYVLMRVVVRHNVKSHALCTVMQTVQQQVDADIRSWVRGCKNGRIFVGTGRATNH